MKSFSLVIENGSTWDWTGNLLRWKGTTESKRNCLATGETIAVVASLHHAKKKRRAAQKKAVKKERGELPG
jgi:hypothetical protein